MKKHINILLSLGAIAALVASAVGLRHWLASAEANKNALTAMLEKNAILKTQIASLQSEALASRQTDATKNASNKIPIEGQHDQTPNPGKARVRALEEHTLNDREFGLKFYATLRLDVDIQYSLFYRLQHLAREQRDALAEALFQKKLRYDRIEAREKVGELDADAKSAKASADAEFTAAAQEALGADLYGQFQIYERQRPAWDYVSGYAGMLSLVDKPLSMEQAAQLTDVIANLTPAFQKGGHVDLHGMGATGWDAVYSAAAKFLTPEQLDVFKNIGDGTSTRQVGELAAAATEIIVENPSGN